MSTEIRIDPSPDFSSFHIGGIVKNVFKGDIYEKHVNHFGMCTFVICEGRWIEIDKYPEFASYMPDEYKTETHVKIPDLCGKVIESSPIENSPLYVSNATPKHFPFTIVYYIRVK